jgi:eukaryotic-like serine/threonine-protein kinase
MNTQWKYCDATLGQYIASNNAKLSFGTRKRVALQFLYGLNYLHSKGHLHRDVSYGNVLVKRYDGVAVVVKLSDFGLLRNATPN